MAWIQKCEIDDEPLPLPVQAVSNEEFEPIEQTEEQKRVSVSAANIRPVDEDAWVASQRVTYAHRDGLEERASVLVEGEAGG